MPGFRPFRCLVVPFMAAALLPVGAEAAPSLAQAIKQADAKYLKLKENDAKPVTPNIEAGGFEERRKVSPRTRRSRLAPSRPRSATGKKGLARRRRPSPSSPCSPTASRSRSSRAKATGIGRSAGQRADRRDRSRQSRARKSSCRSIPAARIAAQTPRSSPPARTGRAGRPIELGQFDGGPLLASDLAGDGRKEFETRDNAFLYTFGCYACSTAASEDPHNRGWRSEQRKHRPALPCRPRVLISRA